MIEHNIIKDEDDCQQFELADIINRQAIQSMMDDFYAITNTGIGIIDLKGDILVATGWQDIDNG